MNRKLSMDELQRLGREQFRGAPKFPVSVILDNVRSKHNIGSVFRTADAFRAEQLLLCGITACPPDREIQRTALDATDSVLWSYYETTAAALALLKAKQYCVVGVEQTRESESLDAFTPDFTMPLALVFGNEVHGISEEILPLLNSCIEIPQFGTKHSLNISVSAGIVLWHLTQIFLSRMEANDKKNWIKGLTI